MTKKDSLESIVRKITGDDSKKCSTVKDALHCIAEEAKGESVNCSTINEALICINENIENIIGVDRVAEAITITENGVTNTPAGKYYDPITVNVSGGGSGASAYCWSRALSGDDDIYYFYLNTSVAPNSIEELKNSLCLKTVLSGDSQAFNVDKTFSDWNISEFVRVSDTEFTFNISGGPGGIKANTFTRVTSKDITLWEVSD